MAANTRNGAKTAIAGVRDLFGLLFLSGGRTILSA
jgi:hypothetical protein